MKVLIKTGLVAFLLLISVIADAQDKAAVFGVRAGINISGYDESTVKKKVGLNIGVTADFRLSDYIYLLTGLEYTVKGGIEDNVFEPAGIDAWGVYHPDGYYSTNQKPAYLQMPLHAGYLWAINRDFRLMFHAGLYIAYGVGGKTHRETVYIDGTPSDEENIPYFGIGITKFDWGLGGGINLEYDRYVLGLGYDCGLRNVFPGYSKAYTRNFYITLGYLF